MAVPSSPHPPSTKLIELAIILALSASLPCHVMATKSGVMEGGFSSSGSISRDSSSSLLRNDHYYWTRSSEIELIGGPRLGTATYRDSCCCCCCGCSHTPQSHPHTSVVAIAAPGAATNTLVGFLGLVVVVIASATVFTVKFDYRPGNLRLQVAVKCGALSLQLLEFGLYPRPYLKLFDFLIYPN